jgi:hypothetical protein
MANKLVFTAEKFALKQDTCIGEHWGLSSFCDFSNLFFHKNRVVCHVHRISMDSVKNFLCDLRKQASFPNENDSMRTLLKNQMWACKSGHAKVRKSANYWTHSAIANLQIFRYAFTHIANPQIYNINLQVANLQISTKYCTTLSQISPKS